MAPTAPITPSRAASFRAVTTHSGIARDRNCRAVCREMRQRPATSIAGALLLSVALVACTHETGGPVNVGVTAPSSSVAGQATSADEGPLGLPAADFVVDPVDEARAEELLTVLTPPPPERVELQNDWIDSRRKAIQDAHREHVGVGVALMRRVDADEHDRIVRRAALELAAHAAPEQVSPYLARLVVEYGEDLGLRETATRVLGDVDPDLALEVLEPLVREDPRGTYPPSETILVGWLTAAAARDVDPSSILALVATDLRRDESTRHRAVRELALAGTPLAREALRAVLLESTGNGYLRRLAAQGVVDAFPEAEACALLEEVALLEADPNMQLFLANLVQANCP
ncbi:hypothetical protein [Engelhardtia mirabilis]